MAIAPDAASIRCAAELLAGAERQLAAGGISEACRLVECAEGVLWFMAQRDRLLRLPDHARTVIFKNPAKEDVA